MKGLFYPYPQDGRLCRVFVVTSWLQTHAIQVPKTKRLGEMTILIRFSQRTIQCSFKNTVWYHDILIGFHTQKVHGRIVFLFGNLLSARVSCSARLFQVTVFDTVYRFSTHCVGSGIMFQLRCVLSSIMFPSASLEVTSVVQSSTDPQGGHIIWHVTIEHKPLHASYAFQKPLIKYST